MTGFHRYAQQEQVQLYKADRKAMQKKFVDVMTSLKN